MPLTRSLRQPHRRSTTQIRRKPCQICHNLNPRGHPSSVYSVESEEAALASLSLVLDSSSLAKTKDTQEGGCRFCAVLCQALDAFSQGWRDTLQRVNVDLKEKGTIKVGLDANRWKGERIEIYAGSASRAPWPTLGTTRHIPVNSGSDDTFNFARRCIQDCMTNSKHVACKLPSRSSAAAPKRLLDVGRVTAPIRLIDTQGKHFEYAALSHCWGAGPALTVTKLNWKKLASSIPFESLPPLFQDAVVIVRQLGLRYIWIDALCIIQDSVRDWETESAKMGGIYENSHVTISATSSGDGTSRCLLDRRKAVKLNYQNTTGKEAAVRARKIEDHHPNLAEAEPAKPLGRLATRAWALQEHVLSTRVLHYTGTELLFECKTSYRCECTPGRKTYPTTPALIPRAIAKSSKTHQAIWNAWHQIVEQYSKRDLTVPTDKLPAISGIASRIGMATGSSYIAGVWENNLASDLLWSTSLTTLPDAHYFALEKYRAPSFSWASLNAPIAYHNLEEHERETFTPTISLISSSTTATGLNPLGAVSCSRITLRGPVVHAMLSSMKREGMWEYTLAIKRTSGIIISHDSLLVEDYIPASDIPRKTVRRAQCGDKPSDFKTSVLCLGVARQDSWISGLVLGLSQRGRESYERLGTFSAGMEAFENAYERELEIM
ncbi:HET-domain-containing protein [Massarina eburnea CBS 473.64]|uniref:HET-domain-containing protein n=1 Tax=Massarina eburnea CBS 473.64 TaxID=1395130 RepID=A0A6A6RLE1_9PLEO|nr:HET-domain-containing protein [Massarina eburnea CBS 473.64]